MEGLKIKGKAIYTTKGAAREYGRIGCNFYKGCPHECSYCYLKRGAPSKQLGGNVAQLKKCFKDEADAARILRKELDKYLEPCQRYGIFLSFTTDPMILNTRELTGIAITEALVRDIPVWILTKDASFVYDEEFMKYIDIINNIYRDRIHFGFTLTGRDDMEPHASTNLDRINAMRWMNIKGFSTFASIEPVIDWRHAYMMVECSLEYCDHYKIGLRSGVKKDYYNVLESGLYISDITKMITDAGKTVYLKESTRELLRRNFEADYYSIIMARTVDSDGNKIELL
jgi:DNA repair photolyase